jgi:ligand-binding SRPBCC domain-containing protein
MSWVHIQDVVGAMVFAMETAAMNGVYNLVAPETARQKKIAQVIANQLNSFYGPPVPQFMLKLILGEQAGLALNSLNVSSQKLVSGGYKFHFSNVDAALQDLLSNWKNGVAVKTYQQYFPLPKEKVFAFFADAKNLEHITPKTLHFKITKMSTERIQKDTLIDYKLKIHSVPARWRTHIQTWEPNTSFSDTQLKGPYSLWHHTHSFEQLGTGTLMTDIVRYKLPAGLMGRLTAQAWVDSDVEKIFAYRRETVGALI